MAGRKRKQASTVNGTAGAIPGVYQDMLDEAGAAAHPSLSPESPSRKRKRPGERRLSPASEAIPSRNADEGSEDDGEIEFEDVPIPAPNVQTIYRDGSGDSEEDEDIEFEDVQIGTVSADGQSAHAGSNAPASLELDLTAHWANAPKKGQDRRRPLSRVERERRIDTHKTHLLCLVLHSALRNRWCDDPQVQKALRPLLTEKMRNKLNPRASLSQFGKTESLKDGLQQLIKTFRGKFQITERGLRRSLWAEDPDCLSKYELPDDIDSCIHRDDFRRSALQMQGSRDVGAQLFCSLLRCAGLRARLVCSLQPLPAGPGGPVLQKPREKKTSSKPSAEESAQMALPNDETKPASPGPSARRRLGHPNAAAYQRPDIPSGPSHSLGNSERHREVTRIRESPFPVYWVEILDVAHQKWQPIDPLATGTMWKPAKLEPPASDRENCMSYVLAFEADGTARDVTRRYAKAYAAKTRKLRVETATPDGERWWRKALALFSRQYPTDLDQIEDNELTAMESREPMPRNVTDFKDHLVYALERHLRRHEVLAPGAQAAGTVGAGSRGPLEKVYRRKDVHVARSRDKWYRLGREVKPMEVPVKFLPRRANARVGEYVDDGYGGDERDAAGMPVFTLDQTSLFKHPAVVKGKVPKNKFGNIDVYVPSMVPDGGVYIPDEIEDDSSAARAAFVLGIDYAPALTGFQFKGRQGTAVLNGVVVAEEHEEAVRSVMEGLGDVEAEREAERRGSAAVRMWKRFLVALRIRERIYAGVDPGERAEDERNLAARASMAAMEDEGSELANVPTGSERSDGEEVADAVSDVTEEYVMDDEDLGGGGFLVE